MGYHMKIMDWVAILNQNNPQQNPTIWEQIAYAAPRIFNFPYNFWEESAKEAFQQKFVTFYFTHELGLDTPAMFQLRLKAKLDIVMPYYTQLFESQLLEFKPFDDMNIVEVLHRENDKNKNGTESNDDSGTSSQTGKTSNTGTDTMAQSGTDTTRDTGTQKDVGSQGGSDSTSENSTTEYSDTPQAMLANKNDPKYLTNRTTESGTSTTTYGKTDNNTRTNDLSSATTYGKTDTRTLDLSGDSTFSQTVNNTRNKTISDVEKAIEEYTRTTKGKSSRYTYMQLLEQYRKTFLNIEQMLIESLELKSLFMGIL